MKQHQRCLIPFFPYESYDRGDHYASEKIRHEHLVRSHRAKFSRLHDRSMGIQKSANIRARETIQARIQNAEQNTKQFVNLATIDQLIVRERTREYLDHSTRRIRNELLQAQDNVRNSVSGSVIGGNLRQRMEAAKTRVLRRALGIEAEVQVSAKAILARRELMQKYSEAILNNAQQRILQSKQKLEQSRNALLSKVLETKAEAGLSDGWAQIRGGARVAIKPSEVKTDLSSPRMVKKSPTGSALEFVRSDLAGAVKNFKDGARRAKVESETTRERAERSGQEKLKKAHESFLSSKTLFQVDVRFAQARVLDASRKSKIRGVRMTQVLAQRRLSHIEIARARRKAQAIRNALTLIRTIS